VTVDPVIGYRSVWFDKNKGGTAEHHVFVPILGTKTFLFQYSIP